MLSPFAGGCQAVSVDTTLPFSWYTEARSCGASRSGSSAARDSTRAAPTRRSRAGAARRDARRGAGAARRGRNRRVGAAVPPAHRVRCRMQLEGRLRELPRVLPLPGRASRVQRGGRRLPRCVPASDRAPHVEPVRAVTRRERRRAVPLCLAEPEGLLVSWPANLAVGPVVPRGPERSAGFLDYFFVEDADETAVRELLDLDDQVGREDAALIARVQRGVGSGVLSEGRLLGEAEQLISHFDRLVAQASPNCASNKLLLARLGGSGANRRLRSFRSAPRRARGTGT
jgi:Ring hydroxylating alpha subunit (catalytic domain)